MKVKILIGGYIYNFQKLLMTRINEFGEKMK